LGGVDNKYFHLPLKCLSSFDKESSKRDFLAASLDKDLKSKNNSVNAKQDLALVFCRDTEISVEPLQARNQPM
jgi:hypothetical protein